MDWIDTTDLCGRQHSYYKSWLWLAMMMATTINDCRVGANKSINDGENMVAHGTVYDSVKYPYIIHVLGPAHSCTGSLIQPLFVLTAAHCTWKMTAKDMKVYRGHITKSFKNPELMRTVQVIHQHDEYQRGINQMPDLSLLEIESEYKGVDSYIQIAGTPEEFSNGRELHCVVIGFGQQETDKVPLSEGIQSDVMVRYGKNACAKPAPRDDWKYFLCPKPNKKMVCQGDSGGPLICNDKLYGTVKDGYNYVTGNYTICGDPEVQTRHIFLYMFKDWIDDILQLQSYDDYYDNAPTNRQYFTIVAFFAILSLSGQVVLHSI